MLTPDPRSVIFNTPMDIHITRHPAPTIDPGIQAELDAMDPRVFMRWNSTYEEGQDGWEGRWEIWVELKNVSHPDARNELAEGDEWNTDAQCWMRFLQTYETADGEFAPADRGLVIGLELADGWANRRFYEEHVEEAHDLSERARIEDAKTLMKGRGEYYMDLDRTLVGPSGSGDWRWRVR